jgi:hypothetical protein
VDPNYAPIRLVYPANPRPDLIVRDRSEILFAALPRANSTQGLLAGENSDSDYRFKTIFLFTARVILKEDTFLTRE